MHNKEKYNLAMNKVAKIFSKIISNQNQLIIEGKSLQKAWNTL